MFADRTLTPSYVADVVEATCRLVETGAPAGLYHCVNSGVTNWLELAEELARLTGRSETARFEPVAFASVSLKAKRPQVLRVVEREAAGGGGRDAGVARCPPALSGSAASANGGLAAALEGEAGEAHADQEQRARLRHRGGAEPEHHVVVVVVGAARLPRRRQHVREDVLDAEEGVIPALEGGELLLVALRLNCDCV